MAPNRPRSIKSVSLRRSCGMADKTRSAARGEAPTALITAMRLREFQTGRYRLRSSASALANQAGSFRKCASRSKYGPAKIFPCCMQRIIAGRRLCGVVDGALAIGAGQLAFPQKIAHAHAAAKRTASDAHLIVARQRQQQKPGVLA